MPGNEGKACDAVLRVIERRVEASRSHLRFPEQDGCGAPVELECQIGDGWFALEHTVIEAFGGQIVSDVQFGRLLGTMVEGLIGRLPAPGTYHLMFPTEPHLGWQASQHRAVQEGITQWVRSKAHELHGAHPDRLDRHIEPHGHTGTATEQPVGVPFEVTLTRTVHWAQSGRHDGPISVARSAPADLEDSRKVRLATALSRKCPKLQTYKVAGRTTVLILESDDIALTNHVSVGEALEEIAAGRDDVPDEIYFFSSQVTPWTVWTLCRNSTILPDEGYLEFSPESLTDITGSSR
jgi:hypothetical protein